MKIPTIAAALSLVSVASAEIFLHETFSDGEGWKERWTPSTYREDLGKLEVSPGKWFADEKASAGLRTSEDYRFYATSTKTKPFSNKDKDLVIQFDVKNEQDIDCGGSYLKFFNNNLDAKTFNGDSEYNIMFGPDICGPKAMVHAIFNYKGTNYDLKKSVEAPKDAYTHTYTLIVKPDQTYEILVDSEKKASGSLLEDWDFLPPKQIKDPKASKPTDWVDEAEIDDPEDVKPEGYDSIPEFIADPSAKKPEDWDDDMDGDWEAPSVANPEFKGPWAPKRIANPLYKGEWEHPLIDNAEYKVDNEIYAYEFGNVGLDVWQVSSGTILDNILLSDSIEEAEKIRKENEAIYQKEKEAKTAHTEKLTAENKEKMAAAAAESANEENSQTIEDLDVDALLEKQAEKAAETKVSEPESEDTKKPAKDEL